MSQGFYQQVYALLSRVPAGRVVTYGDIARMLGRPGAGRLVGWAMRSCPEGLAWHRVLNAQGRPSTTARLPDGQLMQQALLEEEGVAFDEMGCVDLDRFAWTGPADG